MRFVHDIVRPRPAWPERAWARMIAAGAAVLRLSGALRATPPEGGSHA